MGGKKRCSYCSENSFVPTTDLSAPSESLPHWFQGNFAATFVLSYWLRELLLSVSANCFELKCEPKQLMLLH